MSVLKYLQELKKKNISISLVDDQLKVVGDKKRLTPELLAELRQNKESIIHFLAKRQNAFVDIESSEKRQWYPASLVQKRFYFMQSLAPDSVNYNISQSLDLGFGISPEKVQHMIDALISRHESLRTSFVVRGEEVVQQVADRVHFELELYEQNADTIEDLEKRFVRPFDLSSPPLLRAGLCRAESGQSILMLDVHHIVTDGVSFQILKNEFLELYHGNPLPALKLQYKDFSNWQNSPAYLEKIASQKNYWVNKFSHHIVRTDLPYDMNRPQTAYDEGGSVSFVLTDQETALFSALSAKYELTPFVSFLALMTLFLHKLTGEADVVIGTSVSGRTHPSLEKIIGMFVNTVVHRNYMSPEMTIAEAFSKIRDNYFESAENEDYPFEDLMDFLKTERTVNRNPVFDVMLNVFYDENQDEFQGTSGSEYTHVIKKSNKFDLTLNALYSEKKILLNFQYWTKLFKPSTIDQFILWFRNMLTAVNEEGVAYIRELPLLSFNDTQLLMEKIRTIPPKDVNYFHASQFQNDLCKKDNLISTYLTSKTSANYNMPLVAELEGALDLPLLDKAIREVLDSHDILRTQLFFDKINDQSNEVDKISVLQLVLPKAAVHFKVKHLKCQSASFSSDEVRSMIEKEIETPFILSRDTLFRAVVIELSNSQHVLVLTCHHTIADRETMGVIFREILHGYSRSGQISPSRDQSLPFFNYSEWERSYGRNLYLNHVPFWKSLYQTSEIFSAFSKPARAVVPYQSALHQFRLSADIAGMLTKFSAGSGIPAHKILLSVFNILLSKYSSQSTLIVGVDSGYRSDERIADILGPVTEMTPFKTLVDPFRTFSDYLSQMAVEFDRCQQHALPLARLEKGLAHLLPEGLLASKFYFRYETSIGLPAIDGLSISLKELNRGQGILDLNLLVKENEGNYAGFLTYDATVFTAEEAERIGEYYQELMRNCLSQADRQIKSIDLLSPARKRELLEASDAFRTPYPADTSLMDLFEEQVAKFPGNPALVYEGESYSYAELNEKANQFASFLHKTYAVSSQDTIGICMERSASVVISIMGILKLGAVYVPINTDYPPERLSYILNDSACKLLVDEHVFQKFNLTRSLYSKANLKKVISARDLAYIIYTSGSTGNPKGVMVEHRSVVRLVKNTNYFQATDSDCILSMSNFSFDGSVFDIFASLLNGATLVVPGKQSMLDEAALNKLIEQNRVTVFFMTTALFNSMVDNGFAGFSRLRCLLFGGEQVSVPHVIQFREQDPDVTLLHVYGPTENTTFSTYYTIGTVTADMKTIPIGLPIANTRFLVCDDTGGLRPVGLVGELYVGGDGLARGYINNPTLTAEKFVPDPFNPGEYLYKTGDLVCQLPDGNIEFVGRKDFQVKIRGYRIELGEIEACFRSYPAISEAVLKVRGESDARELLAYYTSTEPVDVGALRAHLSSLLPDYMIPAHLTWLSKMPLTLNGKIDKNALPDPEIAQSSNFQLPTNEIEEKIREIWSGVLMMPKEKIGIHDNFFDIGGHSIKILKVVSLIKKEYGCFIPLMHFYNSPLISELAKTVNSNTFSSNRLNVFNKEGQMNVFCFPPASTYGICYQSLAEHIKACCFHCFNYQKTEDDIASFADEITSAQPDGPIMLMGYSGGGKVLFPVAKELERRGRVVSKLILIDSYWDDYKGQSDFSMLIENVDATLKETGTEFLRDEVIQRIKDYDALLASVKYEGMLNADLLFLVAQGHAVVESEEHMLEETGRIMNMLEKHTKKVCQVYRAKGLHNELLSPEMVKDNHQIIRQILTES